MDALAEIEFGEDVTDMGLDGDLAQLHLGGDLGVRESSLMRVSTSRFRTVRRPKFRVPTARSAEPPLPLATVSARVPITRTPTAAVGFERDRAGTAAGLCDAAQGYFVVLGARCLLSPLIRCARTQNER